MCGVGGTPRRGCGWSSGLARRPDEPEGTVPSMQEASEDTGWDDYPGTMLGTVKVLKRLVVSPGTLGAGGGHPLSPALPAHGDSDHGTACSSDCDRATNNRNKSKPSPPTRSGSPPTVKATNTGDRVQASPEQQRCPKERPSHRGAPKDSCCTLSDTTQNTRRDSENG